MTADDMVAKSNQIKELLKLIGYRGNEIVVFKHRDDGKWSVSADVGHTYEFVSADPVAAADNLIQKIRGEAMGTLDRLREQTVKLAKALNAETLEEAATRKPDPPDPKGPAPESRVAEPYVIPGEPAEYGGIA